MDVKGIISGVESMTEFWDEIVTKNNEALVETCMKVYEEAYRRGYKEGQTRYLKPTEQQEEPWQ